MKREKQTKTERIKIKKRKSLIIKQKKKTSQRGQKTHKVSVPFRICNNQFIHLI